MGTVKVYSPGTVPVNAQNANNVPVNATKSINLFSSGEVFPVTYEKTKLSEIREALKRGKVCVCEYDGVQCWLDSKSVSEGEAFFAGLSDGGGSGKVLIQCVSMAEIDGSKAWINWTVDPTEKPENVFRVEAFYTSYEELAREYRAGKLCVCRYANRDYILGYMPAGYYGYAKFYVNDEYGFNILQLMAGTNDWSVVEKPYPGGDVDSVNGKTGEVVLTAEDVGALPANTPIPSLDGYATEEWVENKGYLTEHQSLDGYATESYVNDHHDASKQDALSDLAAIRSGAAKGATALQSVPAAYRTAAAQDAIDAGKVDKVNGKGLSANDYDAAAKAKVDAIPENPKYTDTVYDDTAIKQRVSTIEGKEAGWDGKQDALIAGSNITIVGNVISATGGGGGGAVDSVNGKTGAVVLKASDVGAVAFDNTYITDANTFYSINGYAKTSTSTAHLPSVCTGSDRWGVIFFIAENAANHTGTQMFFPIDGENKGRIFYRSMVSGTPSDWNLIPLTGGGGDTEEFTNAEVDAIWNEVMA